MRRGERDHRPGFLDRWQQYLPDLVETTKDSVGQRRQHLRLIPPARLEGNVFEKQARLMPGERRPCHRGTDG